MLQIAVAEAASHNGLYDLLLWIGCLGTYIIKSSWYTGYCDIMVAKEKLWLLGNHLKSALLPG